MDDRVKQRLLKRQEIEQKRRIDNRPWRNSRGYSDPTAYQAIANIIREEKRSRRRRRKFHNLAEEPVVSRIVGCRR